MSVALTQAIYSIASTTPSLTSLLGTVAGGPAIYYWRKMRSTPVFPSVEYRQVLLDQDVHFWQGGGYVDKEFYEFYIWTSDASSDKENLISDQLDLLFHKNRIAVTYNPTHNYNYWCERVDGCQPDDFNPDTKYYFGIYRYLFIEGRG